MPISIIKGTDGLVMCMGFDSSAVTQGMAELSGVVNTPDFAHDDPNKASNTSARVSK